MSTLLVLLSTTSLTPQSINSWGQAWSNSWGRAWGEL